MSLNPYESPRTESSPEEAAQMEQGLPWVPMSFVIAWTALLFLGLPAVQRIPIFLRIAATIMSLVALLFLMRACRRVWHYAAIAPMILILCTLQYLVWVFPRW